MKTMTQIFQALGRVTLTLLVLNSLFALLPSPAHAKDVAPAVLVSAALPPVAAGDVFVGIGNGRIARYDATGRFVQELDTTTGSREQGGMCLDTAGNLYTTNWTARTMSTFDPQGKLRAAKWGGLFSDSPHDCVVSAKGEVYVSQVDGVGAFLRKYDATGALLAEFTPAPERRQVAALALAADQCTLFYTSQGRHVKRFDVCTNTQLEDFAALPIDTATTTAYGLRVRANGEVLVAAMTAIYRLDATGAVLQTYTTESAGETSFFLTVSLDPDGTSFWTAGFWTGNIYKVDIATGAVLTFFTAPPAFSLAGLAVVLEAPVATSLQDEVIGEGYFPKANIDYAFALSCNLDQGPSAFAVVWAKDKHTTNAFVLEALTSALCSDSQGTLGPGGHFDTHQGTGTGRINGVPGFRAEWTLTSADAGSALPYAELTIRNAKGNKVLKVKGLPSKGG